MRRALILALVLIACAAPARGQSAAEAFAPLIGCWRGAFEGNAELSDERCFEPLGAHVVDTHHVRPTDYSGEATFHDDGAGGIIFAYAASDGGRSNGALRAEGARYVIAPHTHIGGEGTRHRLRGVWTLEAPDRLVMETEREEGGVWRPYMRITYTRVSAGR
jgi:hypothetical protein